jgi:hypothetical protein
VSGRNCWLLGAWRGAVDECAAPVCARGRCNAMPGRGSLVHLTFPWCSRWCCCVPAATCAGPSRVVLFLRDAMPQPEAADYCRAQLGPSATLVDRDAAIMAAAQGLVHRANVGRWSCPLATVWLCIVPYGATALRRLADVGRAGAVQRVFTSHAPTK